MTNDDLIRMLQAKIRDYEDENSRLRSEKIVLTNENEILKTRLSYFEQQISTLRNDAMVGQASLDMAMGNSNASQFIGSTPQDIMEEAANQEMQSENAKKFL